MSIIKRLVVVSGLAGLLMAMAVAVPAQAGTGVHVKCIVRGNAKTTPPVPLTGGKGEYDFAANADCVAVESPPLKIVTIHVAITSHGTYKNLVCGTGKATSDEDGVLVIGIVAVSPESKIGPEGYGALIEGLKYEVEFAGSKGILYWHNETGKFPVPVLKPLDGVDEKPHDEKARYEGGTVRLFAPQEGEKQVIISPQDCTKSFDVQALIDISDPMVP
jgi:hypothetical protein